MPDQTELVKRIQAKLSEARDGIIGPKTILAICKALGVSVSDSGPMTLKADQDHSSAATGSQEGRVDSRSEGNIATLHPKVQPLARRLIRIAKDQGMTFKVTSAYRSYFEQDELYEQGRTKPGKIVTNARGGQSAHQFKIAFDCTLFDGNSPVWESPKYAKLGSLGESIGLNWGGRWTNPDLPHFYFKQTWALAMSESQVMAELRRRHDNGIDLFA